jgi:hypothetical protein
MFNILESFYSKVVSEEEGFTDRNYSWLPLMLALITLILLQLLLGKVLWNNYLVRLIPAIQPARGIIDILAISFLVRLMFN